MSVMIPTCNNYIIEKLWKSCNGVFFWVIWPLQKQLATVTFHCSGRDVKILDKNDLEVTAARQN